MGRNAEAEPKFYTSLRIDHSTHLRLKKIKGLSLNKLINQLLLDWLDVTEKTAKESG